VVFLLTQKEEEEEEKFFSQTHTTLQANQAESLTPIIHILSVLLLYSILVLTFRVALNNSLNSAQGS